MIGANTITITTTTTTGPNLPPDSGGRFNTANDCAANDRRTVQSPPSSLELSVFTPRPLNLASQIKPLDKLRLLERFAEMERGWKSGGHLALKTRLIRIIMSFSTWSGFPAPRKELRLWNENKTATLTPPIEVFLHRFLRPFLGNDPDAAWQLDYPRRAFACLLIFVFELLVHDQYSEADAWLFPAVPVTDDIEVLFANGRCETLVRIQHDKLYVALAHGLRELYPCHDEWDRDFEDSRNASILDFITDRFKDKNDHNSIVWGNLAAHLAFLLNSAVTNTAS